MHETWRLYKTNFVDNLKLFVPLLAVAFLIPELLGLVDDPDPNTSILYTSMAILLGLVLPTLIGSYLVAASHVVMADRLAGRYSTPAAALRTLRGVTKELLSAAFLATTLVLLVSLLPVLNFARTVMWGPPILISAVALEHLPVPQAWGVSRGRLGGNWGRVLLFLLVVGLVTTIIQLLLYTPIVYLDIDGAAALAVSSLSSVLVASLTLPFVAAATLVAYFDVRARENGFGLDELREERGRIT